MFEREADNQRGSVMRLVYNERDAGADGGTRDCIEDANAVFGSRGYYVVAYDMDYPGRVGTFFAPDGAA